MKAAAEHEAPVDASRWANGSLWKAFKAFFTNARGAPEAAASDSRIVHIEDEAWERQFACKQWTMLAQRNSTGDVTDYRLVNLDGDGKRQYYEVYSGTYGQPLVLPEPERALG